MKQRKWFKRRPDLRLLAFAVSIFLCAASQVSLFLRLASHGLHDDQPKSFNPSFNASFNQRDSQRNAQPNNHATTNAKIDRPLVVDIASIGSIHRLDYIRAQMDTFGSHITVRNFFNFTERTDADPNCATKITTKDTAGISSFCKRPGLWDPTNQFVMTYWQGPFARAKWIAKKANPAGWMCAQTRPAQAFHSIVQHYQTPHRQQLHQQQQLQLQEAPDYLIIMDDDTYFNMDLFQDYFDPRSSHSSRHERHELYRNSSIPMAIAGCMVRSPIRDIHLTIPFGGYGIILSKGYLHQVLQPIDCANMRSLCHTIRHVAPLKEASLLRPGMNIADLVRAYATNQPYADYRNWTVGFCLHSDWLWGVITNFYNISRHNAFDDENFRNVPQERMEAYHGSTLYAGNPKQGGRGNCNHMQSYCHSLSPVCHYSTPDRMHALTNVVRQRNPTNYRTPAHGHSQSALPRQLKIDVLSIGSLTRPEHHAAQQQTIARHKSVRNFIPVNEHSVFSPSLQTNCFDKMSQLDLRNLKTKCADSNMPHYKVFLQMQGAMSPESFCQQKVLAEVLLRTLQQYSNQKDDSGSNGSGGHGGSSPQEYPDYLLIIHDTTYINIEAYYWELLYHHKLRDKAKDDENDNVSDNGIGNDADTASHSILTSQSSNHIPALSSSIPWSLSGCIRRIPSDFQCPIPKTEYGLVLSKGLVQILNQPIVCSTAERRHPFCTHIVDTHQFNEQAYFKDGMSLIELFCAMVMTNRGPTTVDGGTGDITADALGCYQMNWLLGIAFRDYNLTEAAPRPSDSGSTSPPIFEAYGGSRHRGLGRKEDTKQLCGNIGADQCRPEAMYCTGIDADLQREYAKHNEHASPAGFHPAEL